MNKWHDCLFRWEPGCVIDLRLLRSLRLKDQGAGKLRLRISQGLVWATRRQRGGPGYAKTGESKDWIFRPGDWLPDWLLDRRGRPAASAIGWLVLEVVNAGSAEVVGAADKAPSFNCPDSWSKAG